MMIASPFKFAEFAREISVGGGHLAQADKGAHDGDVHLYGSFALQHGGEHGNALLGEREGLVAPAAAV